MSDEKVVKLTRPLEPGTVVWLRSGSPAMTVVYTSSSVSKDNAFVASSGPFTTLMWFDPSTMYGGDGAQGMPRTVQVPQALLSTEPCWLKASGGPQAPFDPSLLLGLPKPKGHSHE